MVYDPKIVSLQIKLICTMGRDLHVVVIPSNSERETTGNPIAS